MIFVTIGTQLPFDRLIKALDEWNASAQKDIFAQIGKGKYHPKYMKYTSYLEPTEFQSYFSEANIIISHAGMGTIISSLMQQKTVIVLPRRSELGEHRNNHQMATCKKFQNRKGCFVAWNEKELLKHLFKLDDLKPGSLSEYTSSPLLNTLREYIA